MININNINLYNHLTLIKNNEKSSSGEFSAFKYGYNFSRDVADFKNKNVISFSGQKLSKALEYVQEVKANNKLFSLIQFDSQKLDGILEGTVFEGISLENFKFLCEKLENILLIRGCSNSCSHCCTNAKPFVPGKTGEINTMGWEDLKDLADSIGEIKNRLTFNPIEKQLIPFRDGDPLHLKSYDDKGKPHNITEAVKYFYDKTGIPLYLTTSGWDKKETWVQKAAEELTENTLKIPDSINNIAISINPFHKYMTRSVELEKASEKAENIEEKMNLERLSQQYRQKYVDRMSNVLRTFLPLFEDRKAVLNIVFAPALKKNSGYDLNATQQLFKEIVENNSGLLRYPCNVRQIIAEGRAGRFFDEFKLPWNDRDMKHELTIDVNGKVILINSATGKITPTEMQLNFRNKDKKSHLGQNE